MSFLQSPRFVLFVDSYLRSVGVGAGVGHGEEAGLGVLQFEILIGEFGWGK